MNGKVQKMSGEDRMSTPITVQPSLAIERVLTIEIVRVTERAAVAAARLRGRGNEKAADQAAVDAMRRELNNLPIDGTVVIGEASATRRRCCSSARRSAASMGRESISPSIPS